MSLQKLYDAGVHGETIRDAKATSADPQAVISLINRLLAAVAAGGETLVQKLMALLKLLHVWPTAQRVTAMPSEEETLKHLIDAGVDGELVAKSKVQPSTLLEWITGILAVVNKYGPGILAAIAELIHVFSPQTPAAAEHHQAKRRKKNQHAIRDASDESPIVISCEKPHGLETGATVLIEGVAGNLGANGTWPIKVINDTEFSLDGAFASGSYTGGGVWSEQA